MPARSPDPTPTGCRSRSCPVPHNRTENALRGLSGEDSDNKTEILGKAVRFSSAALLLRKAAPAGPRTVVDWRRWRYPT